MATKRSRSVASGAVASHRHPAVAFHREALTADYWHVIRESFRIEYEDMFEKGVKRGIHSGQRYVNTIAEPTKFWRHCREALAKWVLSQIARYQPRCSPSSSGESAPTVTVDYGALSAVCFLPTRSVLSSSSYTAATAGAGALPSAGPRTYDEQLLRDLTFKSTELVRNSADFHKDVRLFIESFELGKKCSQAAADIEALVTAGVSREPLLDERRRSGRCESAWLRPSIRTIAEGQKTSPAQQRIQGDLVEVGVLWPAGYATDAASSCGVALLAKCQNNVRPVLVPAAAWKRLMICYDAFGAARDAQEFGGDYDSALFAQLRAATVVLRYEHCLASGSLQLCADSALKSTLNRAGYNVLDLCASPINAFMIDQTGQEPVAPRRFCSAFYDTDAFFGSMGSALLFDVYRTYAYFRQQDAASCSSGSSSSAHREAPNAPLLLTLDVPYDEDLCELLFMKLANDCQSSFASDAGKSSGAPWWPRHVDFVLVLPLWWDVPFAQQQCPKRFIAGSEGTEEAMWALVRTHASYLQEGFQVKYRWLTELPLSMAAPAASGREALSDDGAIEGRYLAVFDGVFISQSYTYFCTATNKPLSGVTATEVIGISLNENRGDSGLASRTSTLAETLENFYRVK